MEPPVVMVSGHPTLLSLPLPPLGGSLTSDIHSSLAQDDVHVTRFHSSFRRAGLELAQDTDSRSDSGSGSSSDYSSDSDDSCDDPLSQFTLPPPRSPVQPKVKRPTPMLQIASVRYRNSAVILDDDIGEPVLSKPAIIAPLSPPQSPTSPYLPYLSMDPQSPTNPTTPYTWSKAPPKRPTPLASTRDTSSSLPSPPASPPQLVLIPPSPGFRRPSLPAFPRPSLPPSAKIITPAPRSRPPTPPLPIRPLRTSKSTPDIHVKSDTRRLLARRPTLPTPRREPSPKRLPSPLTLVQQEVSYSVQRLLSPTVFETFITDPSGHRRFQDYLEVTPAGCEPIGLRCDLRLLQQICEEANLEVLTERIKAESARQALVQGGALMQSFRAEDPQQQMMKRGYENDLNGFLKNEVGAQLGKYNVGPRDHSLLGEAFILTNPRLRDAPIVLVSAAFCAMTGYSRLQIVGRNCRFLQGEATSPSSVNTIRTAIAEGVGVTQLLLNYRVDGTAFWNLLCILPLRDTRGEVVYWVGGQTDVSDHMTVGSNLSSLFLGGATVLPPSDQTLTKSRSRTFEITQPLPFLESPPPTPRSVESSTSGSSSVVRFARLLRGGKKASKASKTEQLIDSPRTSATIENRIADFTASHEKVLMFRKEGREILFVTAAFLRCCGLPGSKPQDVCTSPLIHMDILDIVEAESGPSGNDVLRKSLAVAITEGRSLAVRCGIRLRKRTLFGRGDARPPVFGTLQLSPLEDSFGIVIAFIALFG